MLLPQNLFSLIRWVGEWVCRTLIRIRLCYRMEVDTGGQSLPDDMQSESDGYKKVRCGITSPIPIGMLEGYVQLG